MLKLQFRDRRRESVWLVDQNFSIGKAPTNSLMVDDNSVDDFHVEIINKQDQLSLVNISGSETLLLNGDQVLKQAPLKAKDIIAIGQVELELIDPKSLVEQQNHASTTNYTNGWSIFSSASWLDQNRYMIDKKTIIGRDPGCDITLPLEHLSRQHVILEVKNGQLHIQDLDSSNGTFLNGKRVTNTRINAGDKIKLDVLTFEVNGPTLDPNKTIIRTAPAEGKAQPQSKATAKPKPTPRPKAKTQLPSSTNKAKSKVAKKPLASKGKQDWISGNDQIKQNQKTGPSSTFMITVALIVLSALAGLAYMFF